MDKLCTHPEWYYEQFPLPVGDKIRPIKQPIGKLDKILRKVKSILDQIELPSYVHGGVKKHSPITNAIPHVHKTAVLNFDIADFFPSVGPHQVYDAFYKQCRFPADVSRILTQLVTFKGQLPQGSPTSTAVANLVILPLAHRLYRLAEKHGCDYSQFVDDGTISGPGYIERIRPLIDKIIRQSGFQASPKPHKRTTRYRPDEQVVTGVRVDKGIDVPSQKVEKLGEELYQLDIKIRTGKKPSDKEIASLKGKIQFVSTLNPKKGNRFRIRLVKILEKLRKKN
jgi:RNA-directed DNA polymerase